MRTLLPAWTLPFASDKTVVADQGRVWDANVGDWRVGCAGLGDLSAGLGQIAFRRLGLSAMFVPSGRLLPGIGG